MCEAMMKRIGMLATCMVNNNYIDIMKHQVANNLIVFKLLGMNKNKEYEMTY